MDGASPSMMLRNGKSHSSKICASFVTRLTMNERPYFQDTTLVNHIHRRKCLGVGIHKIRRQPDFKNSAGNFRRTASRA